MGIFSPDRLESEKSYDKSIQGIAVDNAVRAFRAFSQATEFGVKFDDLEQRGNSIIRPPEHLRQEARGHSPILRFCASVVVAASLTRCATLGTAAAWADEPAKNLARFIDPNGLEGSSAAVIVPDVPLVHTKQFLPFQGPAKSDRESSTARQQIDAVLSHLNHADLEQVVKINVVAATGEVAGEVRQALAHRFQGSDAKPAVSYVVGKLRDPLALVAIDAVATHPRDRSGLVAHRAAALEKDPALHSTLPPGPKVYVSGQAEKGKDIAEMTRRTMASLVSTLKHLGLEPKDVVQVKSFVGPITAVDEAEAEIVRFFSGRAPSLVYIEWTTAPSIEIEMVVSATRSRAAAGEPVEYVTPPGMTASPVFSRVARMAAGPTIYISGMYGASDSNAQAETGEIFDFLGKLLDKAGSDFRHLVKATYYISTDEASLKLNELRPRFYDPLRPPAASKAPVAGTGRDGKTITLDMIAAPRGK